MANEIISDCDAYKIRYRIVSDDSTKNHAKSKGKPKNTAFNGLRMKILAMELLDSNFEKIRFFIKASRKRPPKRPVVILLCKLSTGSASVSIR